MRSVPAVRELTTAIRRDPDAYAAMVNDYMAGNMAKVRDSAERMNLMDNLGPAPAGTGGQTDSIIRIIIIVVIIILIILLFPKPVQAPTKN